MSITAPQHDVEREQRTREVWRRYAQSLRDLAGADYEAAEDDAWALLQEELAEIEAEAAAREATDAAR